MDGRGGWDEAHGGQGGEGGASKRFRDELKRDLRPIFTAVNAEAALAAFEELQSKWGQRYPGHHPAVAPTPGKSSSRSWTTTWRSAR